MEPPPGLPSKLIKFFQQIQFSTKLQRTKEVVTRQITEANKLADYNAKLKKELEEAASQLVTDLYNVLHVNSSDSPQLQQEKVTMADEFRSALKDLTEWINKTIKWILSKAQNGFAWVTSKVNDFFEYLISTLD